VAASIRPAEGSGEREEEEGSGRQVLGAIELPVEDGEEDGGGQVGARAHQVFVYLRSWAAPVLPGGGLGLALGGGGAALGIQGRIEAWGAKARSAQEILDEADADACARDRLGAALSLSAGGDVDVDGDGDEESEDSEEGELRDDAEAAGARVRASSVC